MSLTEPPGRRFDPAIDRPGGAPHNRPMAPSRLSGPDWGERISASGKPLYLAIADVISDDVRSGALAPGARLPTQRALAAELGVDLTTVTRAYNEAQRRGLTGARVGRGSFIAAAPAVRVYGTASGAPVDMSMNLPPPFADEALVRRMWRGLADLEAREGLPLLLRYQDPGGAAADREAGAAWLADRVPGADASRTLVASGAQAALVAVVGALANPGDTVACEALTYPGLRAAAAHLGVALLGLEMDGEGVTPEALARACRDTGPRAFVCTPTLQNPTTATLSLQRREALAAVARRYRLPIIEDDAYGKLPADPLPSLAALYPERTWHIAGLAKLVSPALRIAYVTAPDARNAEQVAARLRATGMASPITAALASRWIRTGVAARVLQAIRDETAARRRIAADILGPAFAEPAQAFHLWLPLPPPLTRAALEARLQAQAVSVVRSDAFAAGGEPPEAVRIGLGAAESHADLARALTAIREALAG